MAKENNKEKDQIIVFHHGNVQVLQDNLTCSAQQYWEQVQAVKQQNLKATK